MYLAKQWNLMFIYLVQEEQHFWDWCSVALYTTLCLDGFRSFKYQLWKSVIHAWKKSGIWEFHSQEILFLEGNLCNLMENLSFRCIFLTIFPGNCAFFPQFPIKKYYAFVNEELLDNKEGRPSNTVTPAMMRLGQALVYISLTVLVAPIYPNEYLLTDEYLQSSFGYKVLVMTVWGQFTLWKYCSAWLISVSCFCI